MARRTTVLVLAPMVVLLSCSAVAARQLPRHDGPSLAVARATRPAYQEAVSHPVADPYYPAEDTTGLDALHYGLNVNWHQDARRLTALATIEFRATKPESEVSLDLEHQLHEGEVTLDGRTVTATHRGHKLRVITGPIAGNSRHTLAIRYRGKPAPVPAPTTRPDIPDLGWTVQPDGEVWTMQEPYGALTWYPVNDQPSDKAYYDITARTKPAWHAVSNGTLVSDTVARGVRTMHWHLGAPAASYLVTIAIGPYHAYHDTGPHGLPLTYWVRPQNRSVLPALRRTPQMVRWLEAKLGRYPFHSLGTVVVPAKSGMETETMVTLGAGDLHGSDGVPDLLHEYAHQWYGDAVTPTTWTDLWLNESFAMYLQIRWESTHGFATMAQWRAELNRFDQRLRTKYGPPGRYDRRNFAELNVYFCGARMLDRLHSMLGGRLFGHVLRGWPSAYRYRNANRNDWIRYLDATTGRNLRSFVTTWLDSKITPA